MKKLLLPLFLIGLFWSCLWANFTWTIPDIYPIVNFVEIKEQQIHVYWSNFDQFQQIEWYLDNKIITTEKVYNSWHAEFVFPKNISKWNFVLKWRKNTYNNGVSTPKYFEAKWISIYFPIKMYFSNIWWEFIWNWYNFILKLVNKENYDIKFKVFDNTITTWNISYVWESYKIKYTKELKDEWIVATIISKVWDSSLNTMQYYMNDLKLKLEFIEMERLNESIRVYFNIDKFDNIEVYLNWTKLTNEKYWANWSQLYVDFPLYKEPYINNVYIKDWVRVSNTVYFNLKNVLNPRITQFDIWSNKIWETNKIQWKYFSDWYNNIKININWNSYYVSWNDYWKFSKEKNTIMGFHYTNWSYEFQQPFIYTWETNVKITIKDNESNTITFLPKNNKNDNSFFVQDETLTNNLRFSISAKSTTWVKNEKNEQVEIWTFNIKNWVWNSILLKNVTFEIKNDKWDFIPYEYIKLNDKLGYVYEKDNKKYLTFENIYIEKISTNSSKMYIKFSDNISDNIITLIPIELNYFDIDKSAKSESIIKYEFPKDNYIKINSIFNYSNCFDIESDYKNCKAKWYKTKSYYKFSVSWKSVSLDSKQKESATSFLNKLDSLIEKKSKNNSNNKIMLYEKIYNLLKTKVSKLKNQDYWNYIIEDLLTKIK